jgi:hypothetical protein
MNARRVATPEEIAELLKFAGQTLSESDLQHVRERAISPRPDAAGPANGMPTTGVDAEADPTAPVDQVIAPQTGPAPRPAGGPAPVNHKMPPPAPARPSPFEPTIPPSPREQRLWDFAPKDNVDDVDAVRAEVVEIMMAFAPRTTDAETTDIGELYKFALWCYRRDQYFVGAEHLTTANIEQFLSEQRNVKPATIISYRSTMRRMQRGELLVRGDGRPGAMEPYTPLQWEAIKRAARTTQRWAAQTELLATLAGEVGLHTSEITSARDTWIEADYKMVRLTVVSPTGEFRVMPVFDEAATVLARHAGTDGTYLLRPTVTARKNVINSLVRCAAEVNPRFGSFDARKARNTYVARRIQEPIPFAILTALLGLGKSNLPSDMLTHINTPPYEAVERALRAVRRAASTQSQGGTAA